MPIILLLLLAVGLAANVLLGPLGFGIILWRVSVNGLNQTYGADGASLVLVVPAALLAAWLWWKHHRLAAPLALGVGLATQYYAIAEVLGGDYVRYPGTTSAFFVLFLGLIMLAGLPLFAPGPRLMTLRPSLRPMCGVPSVWSCCSVVDSSVWRGRPN